MAKLTKEQITQERLMIMMEISRIIKSNPFRPNKSASEILRFLDSIGYDSPTNHRK